MVLDPDFKLAAEEFAADHLKAQPCPGCGTTSVERTAKELTSQTIILCCTICGHGHLFDVAILKKNLGMP
jgi:transcription elongation factor Elf1